MWLRVYIQSHPETKRNTYTEAITRVISSSYFIMVTWYTEKLCFWLVTYNLVHCVDGFNLPSIKLMITFICYCLFTELCLHRPLNCFALAKKKTSEIHTHTKVTNVLKARMYSIKHWKRFTLKPTPVMMLAIDIQNCSSICIVCRLLNVLWTVVFIWTKVRWGCCLSLPSW